MDEHLKDELNKDYFVLLKFCIHRFVLLKFQHSQLHSIIV